MMCCTVKAFNFAPHWNFFLQDTLAFWVHSVQQQGMNWTTFADLNLFSKFDIIYFSVWHILILASLLEEKFPRVAKSEAFWSLAEGVHESEVRFLLTRSSTVRFGFLILKERIRARHAHDSRSDSSHVTVESHQIIVKVDGWCEAKPVTIDKIGVYFRDVAPEVVKFGQILISPTSTLVSAVNSRSFLSSFNAGCVWRGTFVQADLRRFNWRVCPQVGHGPFRVSNHQQTRQHGWTSVGLEACWLFRFYLER